MVLRDFSNVLFQTKWPYCDLFTFQPSDPLVLIRGEKLCVRNNPAVEEFFGRPISSLGFFTAKKVPLQQLMLRYDTKDELTDDDIVSIDRIKEEYLASEHGHDKTDREALEFVVLDAFVEQIMNFYLDQEPCTCSDTLHQCKWFITDVVTPHPDHSDMSQPDNGFAFHPDDDETNQS